MDKYKITNLEESLIFKPLELYRDLYDDSIPDQNFNMYKYIDMDINQHELYCISDIHADTYRFWNFLYLNNFVLEETIPELSEIKWNPNMKKKALIICGDIIDGRRGLNNNLHSTANNEILIHTIIYNLRLDAVKYNSYIFCTLGNHDFFALHNGNVNEIRVHAYSENMDTNSKENYISIFKHLFHTYFSDEHSNHTVTQVGDFDAAYFARSFILSRFYLIGFPFCLKINTILFAHAGFHKTENIFSLFDNGQNSNTKIQPLLIHRNILQNLSNADYLIGFVEFVNRRTFIPKYADYYDYIFDLVIGQLHRKSFDKELLDKYAEYFKDTISENSIAHNLFLTRKLQKNCQEVDQILQTYGCKMLVLGHCPTCLGTEIFEAKNVIDITNCANARIVFSCSNKLLTVDIAFSSGVSPIKDFLECLHIQRNLTGHFFVKVIRKLFNTTKYMQKMVIEYNYHYYSPERNIWIKYDPNNSSNNSNSDDDDYNHRPKNKQSLNDLFPENNNSTNKSARASSSKATNSKSSSSHQDEDDDDDYVLTSKPSVMDIFGINPSTKSKNAKNAKNI